MSSKTECAWMQSSPQPGGEPLLSSWLEESRGEQIFGLTRFREDLIVPPHKHIARSSGPAPPMLGWETAHGEDAPFRRHLTGRSCLLIPSSAPPGRSAAQQPRGEGTS